jgi:hypothetical protein
MISLYNGSNEITGFYTKDGQKTTSAATAYFAAFATFKAHCPKDANGVEQTSCPLAESIDVGYEVRQIKKGSGDPVLSSIRTSFNTQLLPGKLPASHSIASLTSDSQSNAQVQQQICELQTAQVNQNGGATTACGVNNITVIKLWGNLHRADQCPSGCITTDVNACQSPSSLTAAHNQAFYCLASGSSCENGWSEANTIIKNPSATNPNPLCY